MKILYTFLSLILLVSCGTSKKITKLDPKVDRELMSYKRELNQKKKNGMNVYSPQEYEKSHDAYKKAKSLAHQNKSFNEVTSVLDEGRLHFKHMAENFELAKVHMQGVINARGLALSEGAQELESFKEAEEQLRELGVSINERDINDVIEGREEVKRLYTVAQVEAIRNRELKYAINTYKKAQEREAIDSFESESETTWNHIESARKLIAKHKDTPKNYMDAVRHAEDSAKKLLVLANIASWLENSSTRSATLKLNKDLNSLIKKAQLTQSDLMDYEEKMSTIENEIAKVPELETYLSKRERQLVDKKFRIQQLSRNKRELERKLANNKKLRNKVNYIRNTFNENEAEIYSQGDDLVIRLIGLNFDSVRKQHRLVA